MLFIELSIKKLIIFYFILKGMFTCSQEIYSYKDVQQLMLPLRRGDVVDVPKRDPPVGGWGMARGS